MWLRDQEKQKRVACELSKYEMSFAEIRQTVRLVKGGFDADDAFREISQKKDEEAAKKVRTKTASEKRTLEHSILVLRMAMTRLDSLVEDVNSNDELKAFLIAQRFAIHQLVDNCIKMKSKMVRRAEPGDGRLEANSP